VTAVVQSPPGACALTHARTCGAGDGRISSDTTLASTTITSRILPLAAGWREDGADLGLH